MPINSIPVRQEVTAEVLRVLYNKCPALQSIDREHEKYFEQKVRIGTTLNIKRPWRPVGRTGQGFKPEAIVQTTVPLTISYWRGVDFIYNDTDEALFLNMEQFHEDYSRPIGIKIAEQIEGDLLSFMQVTTPNFVGTAGTLPTTTATYNSARTSLNKLLALDDKRSVIWTSDYEQNMVGQGQTLFNPERTISEQYLEGFVGRYGGFRFMRDEQIPTFTVGTYAGAGRVNGAGQSGSSILTNNWTASSVAVNPGDRFTIANLFKVNPGGDHVVYTGAANLFQMVITQAAVDAAGAVTFNFYPAIIPSGPFQNCSGSPAANAAITFQGVSGSTANTAFYFQKDAFTAAFIKLHEPEDVKCTVMGGEEADAPGIYIRMIRQWQSSGPFAGYETERTDAIYGFAAQYADYCAGVVYG